ncbi:MAG: sensor histidine kinase [Lachnospiraceae bacterium]|nr:sensor histidine kinase [Lachnospiraceae bacterium]
MKKQNLLEIGAKILFLCSGAGLAVIILCNAGTGDIGSALAALLVCLMLSVALILNVMEKKKYQNHEERIYELLKSEGLLKSSNNEPGVHFEDAVDILESRLQETSLAETLKTKAELHALQNQINPHFLYNTLEIIRSRALIQGNKDVAKMAEALALQFRYCINQSTELATLRQELDHIRNYLLIQHYRFQDRFQFLEDIEDYDTVGNCRMPILTLQPIIENALIHGVNPKIEGGTITLKIRTSGNKMFLSIIDTGVGMSEETLQRMRLSLHTELPKEKRAGGNRKNPGIALYNVNQRIKLYFGAEYGVDLMSTEGVGTTVTVTLPMVFME